MVILKFWNEGEIRLDDYVLVNITEDKRTSLLNKNSFLEDKYRIDKDVYMVKNDLFFTMSKILAPKEKIDSMILYHSNSSILIIPTKSHAFWNGKPVEPEKYKII